MKSKEDIEQKIIFTDKLITSIDNQLIRVTDEEDEQRLLRDKENLRTRKSVLQWVISGEKEIKTEIK